MPVSSTAAFSSWGRQPVKLPPEVHTTRDLRQLVQVAWLLLLSTYDDNLHPRCYVHQSGNPGGSAEVSISIDPSLTLKDQACRLHSQSINPDGNYRECSTAIQLGSIYGPEQWMDACEIILVLDGLGDATSASLLHRRNDQSNPRALDEAIGRAETLKTIMSVIVNSPTTTIGDANFLSDHDKFRIVTWNKPLPGPPEHVTIPSAFARRVEESPDAPALCAWDGSMSYSELDAASSEIALLIAQAGSSGPHDMVLFNMRKSKWALVAALAILKSGKAIVPVDPSWPQARFEQIKGITEASLAVCDEETRHVFPMNNFVALVIPPSPLEPTETRFDGRPQTRECVSSDVAYVLFSSGSTGVPKGMLREHGTACTGSFSHANGMHLDRSSRVLQFANHVFDVAMLDFFTTLVMGGCVCIPSESDRKNDLAGFIERSQANWALLTPTVASIIDPLTAPSLKYVTLGGESIPDSTMRKWLRSSKVGINYGSAEVDVTHARDVSDDTDFANVGQRLPSCTGYIVHPDNPAKILPVGALGELVVSGPTMARHYFKDPVKTSQAFIPTPEPWFADGIVQRNSPPWMSRIYRMGDLFRQRADGSLVFVSRKDFQVKVNGQKVELVEIETNLVEHPAVKHCAVLYPSQGPYAKRLVAIVQAAEASSQTFSSRQSRATTATHKSGLSFETATQFLASRLPSYMLPGVFVAIGTMPYTPTMKIDRNRLKDWLSKEDVVSASQGRITHVSTTLNGTPLLPEEVQAIELSTLIADIMAPIHSAAWNSIHGHDHPLADVGIDSAQIMRLASMIQKRFGMKIPAETLVSKDVTIRSLGSMIATGGTEPVHQSPATAFEDKVAFLRDEIAQASKTLHGNVPSTDNLFSRETLGRHVFLTGATGYLGVQILLHLIRSPRVESVAVLVRGAGAEQASERLQHAISSAEGGQTDVSKVRVWPGDLSQPNLSLSKEHWKELSGVGVHQEKNETGIDTIVHCGAVVDWTKSYEDLKAANILSTQQLLNLTLVSRHVRRYIFISGGRNPYLGQDDRARVERAFTEAAQGSAYTKTKFVAERLVAEAANVCPSKSIHIVRPGYLIGSRKDGFANQDDYLWRIIWASLRVQAFNAEEQDRWLFVAETDQVAKSIAALALQDEVNSTTLEVLSGLAMHQAWDSVARVLGTSLNSESAATWLEIVKQDMEGANDHLLWPLADTLGDTQGHLTKGSCLASQVTGHVATTGVEHAMERNLQHLRDVGFFGGGSYIHPNL